VGLSLVPAITATVVLLPRPVAADQVSDLKAQAAQIAKDLVLEQLQVGTYQQQYDVDVARVRQDQTEIASSQNRIQTDVSRVSHDHERLVSEAVSAYINLDPEVSGAGEALFQNQAQAPTKAEYEEVASGDISLAIDTLHTDENGLRVQRTTLEAQEARDQATTNQEAAANTSAQQAEHALESKQAEVTGQLVAAVAQQQAAQATAAAAAVRAAQATASRNATTTTQSAGTAGSPAPQVSVAVAGGNPSLPPFLQCVLQAESGGDYQAVSPGGTYMGGFQFSQSTWNEAAQLAGMPQLINVPPNDASPADQDDLAIALYNADGEQPWNDSCRNG
jgi:peptidoglycan hydrolase CwlO-like protein